MKSISDPISLSSAEAAYLAALLGAKPLVGFSDPFYGWLPEEARSELGRVRQGLVDRGILTAGPEGAWGVDPEVTSLMGACSQSDVTLMVAGAQEGGEPFIQQYHIGAAMAVEQVTRPAGATSSDLSLLTGFGDVHRNILRCFTFQAQAAPVGEMAVISEATLRAAIQLARTDEGQARSALLKAGMSVPTATALAATLAHLTANVSMVALFRGGEAPEVTGMAFLEGANGLWWIQPDELAGADFLTISPCIAEEAAAEVRRAIDRVIPAPHRESALSFRGQSRI